MSDWTRVQDRGKRHPMRRSHMRRKHIKFHGHCSMLRGTKVSHIISTSDFVFFLLRDYVASENKCVKEPSDKSMSIMFFLAGPGIMMMIGAPKKKILYLIISFLVDFISETEPEIIDKRNGVFLKVAT